MVATWVNDKWTFYNPVCSTLLPSYNGNRIYVEDLEIGIDGGLWIGTYFGLIYRNINNECTFYTTENSELPSNHVYKLENDNDEGLWITTSEEWNGEQYIGGIAHLSTSGEWTTTKNNPDRINFYKNTLNGIWINDLEYDPYLPSNNIYAISYDSNGNLWVNTDNGLANYSSNGKWTIYTKDDLPFLGSYNISTIQSDNKGGIWIGTTGSGGGLAYLDSDNEWAVYTKENSKLPFNGINSLQIDNNDGLWIGISSLTINTLNGETYRRNGLVYRDSNNEWTIYTEGNLGLPSNNGIDTLLFDDNGLWIGTSHGSGLLYRSLNNEWKIYTKSNLKLPYDLYFIKDLQNDNDGGLWIATLYGLTYRSASNEWKNYTSNLPSEYVNALESDGNGGMWIGTGAMDAGGLVYYNNPSCYQ